MKKLSVLLFIFTANFAMANDCPELSGSYKQIFPTETATVLNVKSSFVDGTVVYDLNMPNTSATPWSWQLATTGTAVAKNMGALYRNVYEISRCENRQVKATLYGEMVDGDRVINFTQEWFLYHNTIGELVWQINYRDDKSEEVQVSIFKYAPKR